MNYVLMVSLLIALGASPALAASDTREKQMLRRMQQQVQQLEQARAQAEQEKASALADKERLEGELKKLEDMKRKLAAERAARKRLEAELKTAQAEADTLKSRLGSTEKQLADSMALQRTTAEKLAQVENAHRQTGNQLTARQQDLKLCQTHNGSLYTLGREMMQKYRDKSCQDALAQAEPFTGLKKVEVENLLETWRDQLDREKLRAGN